MRYTLLIICCVVLLASPGRAMPSGKSKVLDRGLQVHVYGGIHDAIRSGAMLPVAVEFDNRGEGRVISVTTGPDVNRTKVFRIPAHDRVVKWLYAPIPWNGVNAVRRCTFYDRDEGTHLGNVRLGHHSTLSRRSVSTSGGGSRKVQSLAALVVGNRLNLDPQLDKRYWLESENVLPKWIPTRWCGLSGIDVIVGSAGDLLDERTRLDVILDWTSMGGVLLVSESQPGQRRRIQTRAKKRGVMSQSYGDGIRTGVGGIAFVDRENLGESHTRYFGSDVPMGVGFMKTRNSSRSRFYHRYRRRSIKPKVKENVQPPFWPVLAALTAFSLAVGPVGWWYLVAKKKRGLLYYVLAPALCLGVMIVVVGTDVMNEGFLPYVSCRAVRFIDQRNKRKIDFSQFGVYLPFITTSQLVGAPGELPYFLGGRRWRPDSFDVRSTDAGIQYDGAMPARRHVWYGRQNLDVERRRLTVWEKDGEVWVENHLGCHLESVLVAHEDKRVEIAGGLAPGQKKKGKEMDQTTTRTRVRQWDDKYDRCIKDTELIKSRPLQHKWEEEFEDGQGWVAEVRPEDVTEQVWLDSMRPQNVNYLIYGVF